MVKNIRLTTGMVAAACLFAWMPMASASVVLQANLPGVAVEGSELLVALPIQNAGDSTGFRVIVTNIQLSGGPLDTPTLPVQLGTITPDNASVLDMRFNIRTLRQSFQLEIQGRFADSQTGRDHEFHIHTVIQVPPAAPGSSTVGTNNGTTNTTKGPYPALPQPPQTEDNEFRAPTPLGSPKLVYNPTPTGTPARRRGNRMIRRREFIAGLGSAAAWPLAARAQQAAVPVLGFLNRGTAADSNNPIVEFLQSLKETGFVEGQNVAIEYRWAENQPDRLPVLAADFVRRRVAVIAASGVEAALAAKAATTTIPIVFATGGDPVAQGLVASFNRPGGNLTGIAILSAELTPKRLQLLRELIPDAVQFGILADPANPTTQSVITDLQAAARTLGLQLVVVYARSDSDLETAFASFSQQRVGAVLVGLSAFFNRRIEKLAALAARAQGLQ
jgi:putative tryptophan/tyrosine transport system substrate-binding protein